MADPLERLLIGRSLLGRYMVEEVIGRGGMGVVYRARDQRLMRSVALKILKVPLELSAQDRSTLRERLRREAASAASIASHPNVVQIYDYGSDPELDLDFIAMELLRGRDLKERLRSGLLPLPEARRILLEAARGVAAGHRAGLVHRDVKPANVFLVGYAELEVVKVLDFGIAKAFAAVAADEELTREGPSPHSPSYASPEQLHGRHPITPASDVYQLGLVGYELFAGARPFAEAERARIAAGRAIPLPIRGHWAEVPAEIRQVVTRALEIDPGLRFPDAAAFAPALGAPALSGDHTLALPLVPREEDDRTLFAPSPPPPRELSGVRRSPRRVDHRKTALASIAVAVLALLVWAAVNAVRDGGAIPPGDPPAAADPDPPPPDRDELDRQLRDILIDALETLVETVTMREVGGQGSVFGRQSSVVSRQSSVVSPRT